MGETLSVSIDTSQDSKQPTLEEEAAKYDAPPSNEDNPSDSRPEWLPEKFKSAEDLAKAYSELEKKLGAPKPKDEAKPEAKSETEKDTSDAEASEPEKAARDAAEIFRPVFAIPGQISSKLSDGCHRLIAERIADIATSLDEILEVITPLQLR